MSFPLVALVIFLASVIVVEMSYHAYRTIRNPDHGKIRGRIKALSADTRQDEIPDILRRRVLSEMPFLNRCLHFIPRIEQLERLVRLSNTRYTLGFFILLALVIASIGFLVVNLVSRQFALSALAAATLGTIPFLYLLKKKNRRMAKLLSQLPDTLELIARALRAGHSFSTGMKLAADEFDDPIGPEFSETLDEINYGISVADSLKNLASRLDCPDLKYFVVSVILQRETGGNLAEIMDSIAYLVRERFKFQGKVRALSAEGKLSALILCLLPFFVVIALLVTSPEYIKILVTDTIGQIMAIVSACLMGLGIFVMRRMIDITV
jgi:tight adherence protein B